MTSIARRLVIALVLARAATAAADPGCLQVTPPAPETPARAWHGGAVPAPGAPVVAREAPSKRAGPYELGLKILILSATSDGGLEPGLRLAREALTSLGIPFDHVATTLGGLRMSDGALDLEESPGRGRYYGIVLASDRITYQATDGTWQTGLNDAQWRQLEDYERRYGVRRVAMTAYPYREYGLEAVGTPLTATTALTLLPAAAPHLAGMVQDAVVPLPGSWQNPARVVDSALATPFALFTQPASDGTPTPVAAAVTAFPDGRRQLAFFFAQSVYLVASNYLTPLWVDWLTRGLYTGERRILLSLQVDDLFMNNDIWNPDSAGADDDGSRSYRLSADDFELSVRWQDGLRARLPPGSDFRLEMAANGIGVWQIPNGYARDPLFLAARRHVRAFHWVSHTYSHPDLDDIAFARLDVEVETNRSFLADLIPPEDAAWSSPRALVTPLISGLFNKDALRALYVNDIRYIVGDNSRREHWPLNPYHGYWTSAARNGFEGVLVVPRHAVVVPVSAGPPRFLESFYNTLYRAYWGRDLDAHEILTLEAQRVVRLLLAFRHDPFMFHQANLWSFPWSGIGSGNDRESLLSLWVEYVTRELVRYTTLPIVSAKFDDLGTRLERRMAYDSCGVDARIRVEGGRVRAVRGVAARACRLPVTGLVASDAPGVSQETYGPDHTTYLEVRPGAPFELRPTNVVPF